MTEEHTSEEIKYRLLDLGVQIGNIAIEYIADLEKENAELKNRHNKQMRCAGCIHSDSPCMPTDYEEDEEGFCINYSSLFDELEKWKAEWQEQVQKATDEGFARTQLQIENGKLKEQIADLKDYILKVSKFIHNANNTRPDELAYRERDKLLIKELKLVEKWELSK